MPHPRFYGTFPRIIGRYVRELHLLPLERPMHKMTGATGAGAAAARPRVAREGYAGRYHDLRSRRIHRARHLCRARTNTRPATRTTVLVNGVVVVENAQHTGATPGLVLRRAADGSVG